MTRKLFSLVPGLWLAASCTAPAQTWVEPPIDAPHLQWRTFSSKLVNGPVSYYLYLPPGYEAGAARYPVMYWLHPRGGGRSTLPGLVARLHSAIEAGKAPPMIAVFVNGLPTGGYHDTADGRQPVESIAIRELIPHIDATYRTIADRRGRLIEGFSMGGNGAAKWGFKYPDQFGSIGVFAGALHGRGAPASFPNPPRGEDVPRDDDPWLLAPKNADRLRADTVIRITVGAEDSLRETNTLLHQLLDRLKIEHQFAVVERAGHNYIPLYDGLGDKAWNFYYAAFRIAPSARAADRLDWLREARFGMFIHWGLYVVPSGDWKGQTVPGIGEWIMRKGRIPVRDYEQIAGEFNPRKFDADEWVRLAKAAGQRYLVITAKHHDGFAMWHSKVSKYNVYDATPFHRDPLAELAEACRRHGLRIGFYYSQTQDWHEPDGEGNDWDFPPARNFDRYLHQKAIPQVRELLTGYGPVAFLWFDTPNKITAAQSRELVEVVRSLQPDCLVNARVGNNMGDFKGMDDNEIPVRVLDADWETVMSLNDSWGFKKSDHNWKPAATLIRQLADVVSKHGFFSVNIGPDADGVVPPASVERLRAIGDWLRINGKAVYGAQPSPYPYEFEWGSMTWKPGHLYLAISQWPVKGQFTLYGLASKVNKAWLPAAPEAAVAVDQRTVNGRDELRLSLPAAPPDPHLTVVELEIDGQPRVAQGLVQQPDGKVSLSPAFAAASGPPVNIDSRGIARNWLDSASALSWDFTLYRPGVYEVLLFTSEKRNASDWSFSQWSGDHQVSLTSGGKSLQATIVRQGEAIDPRGPNFRDVRTSAGRITLDRAGQQHLTLRATKINPDRKLGFRLRQVQLVPVEGDRR